MIDGGKGLLCWSTLTIEESICCFGYIFRRHILHFLAHDFSDPWRDAFENMFSEEVVDFDVFDILFELKKELGRAEIVARAFTHQLLSLLPQSGTILLFEIV